MSIMDLQAQLFQAQESAKQRKDGVAPEPSERRRGALDSKYLMRGSNAGVQERNAADMQHVKVLCRVIRAYTHAHTHSHSLSHTHTPVCRH